MNGPSSRSAKVDASRSPAATNGASSEAGHGAAQAATQAAGRKAVDRILGADDTVAQLDLCVSVSSADPANLTWDDLKNERLGHSFLNLRPVDGAQQMMTEALNAGCAGAFGFHPADTVSTNPMHSFTAGVVASDEGYPSNAYITYDLKLAQARELIAYTQAHVHAQYSPFFYNCTTFAEAAVKAAGHSAPDIGGVVENVLPARVEAGVGILSMIPGVGLDAAQTLNSVALPTSLYKGISTRGKRGDQAAHIGQYPEANLPAVVQTVAPEDALATLNQALGSPQANDGVPGLTTRICALPLTELTRKLVTVSTDVLSAIVKLLTSAPGVSWEANGRIYLATSEPVRQALDQSAIITGYMELASIKSNADIQCIASLLPGMTSDEQTVVRARLNPAAQQALAKLTK